MREARAREEGREDGDMTVQITKAERRWHWRTWNLLLQIREATDGEDSRQKCGDMTERNLLVPHTPELRALRKRGWVECVDFGEFFRDNGDGPVELPAWAVTAAGREALAAAVVAGLTIM
jgi:hypothetical protein